MEETSVEEVNTRQQKRYVYYDYLKAILIFFVVLGHALDPFTGDKVAKAFYLFIYTFHMPLFIFISGFFAKWKMSKFFSYILMYFLFEIIHILLKVFVLSPSNSYDFNKILKMFINPQWSLWFLPAFAVWMLSSKLIKKVRIWMVVVAISVTLALGFVPFVGSNYTLSRIFYFFPFYLLGRWCAQNKEKFNEIIKKLHTNLYKIISALILIATLLFLIFAFDLPKDFFYGKTPYKNPLGIVYRIICITLGVINSLAIMILTKFKEESSNEKVYSLSKIGRSTLSIYLFHSLILYFFKKYCAIYFMQHWSVELLICLIVSILITFITSLKPFTKATNFLLNIFDRKKGENYEKTQ